MMESGTAKFNGSSARIDTDKDPSPVSFAPKQFGDIVDGQSVKFQRSSSRPDWAISVVAADKVMSLLAAATPIGGGLTARAKAKVIENASRLIVEAQAAPTEELQRAHLKFALNKMKSIAKSGHGQPGKVGVVAVEAAFK